MKLLEVNNLDVYLKTDEELVHAVRNVSFSIEKGQTLAIVGELAQVNRSRQWQ